MVFLFLLLFAPHYKTPLRRIYKQKKINSPIFLEKWLVIYYFSSGKARLQIYSSSEATDTGQAHNQKKIAQVRGKSTRLQILGFNNAACVTAESLWQEKGTWPPFVLPSLLVLESFPGQQHEWQVVLRAASRERCQGRLRCRVQGSAHLLASQFCHSLLLYRPGSKAWGDETTSQKICRW